MRNLTFTKNRLLKTEWRMFSQIQNEVVMDWAMGMEWWKSKDSADDVVVFKEDLILPHEYWVGRDGMVRPPQEHLPTLPQTPAHSGHCLLTRQSLQTEEKNDIICHPSVDVRGQTGRKSGRLPLLSSLTIILSTSSPSDLAFIIETEGFPSKRLTCIAASWHRCPGAVTFRLPEWACSSASSFVPKTLYHAS